MTWPPPQPWPDPDDQAYATYRMFAPGSYFWAPRTYYPEFQSATIQYLGSRVRR